MKITINKQFTTLDKLERTKEQAQEFKEMLTDGDLMRMFRDAVDRPELGYSDEIIRCELSAFPGGSQETDENHYRVEILMEGFQRFTKVSFYISQSCVIDTRKIWDGNKLMDMYSIEEYKLA